MRTALATNDLKKGSLMTSRLTLFIMATAIALPLLLVQSATAGEPRDHLYCLANTDREIPNLKATALLTPEQYPLFAAQRCRIRLRSGNVCVPTVKDNVRTRDGEDVETTHIYAEDAQPYLCYQVRCPPEGPRGSGLEIEVEDQLGRRMIEIRRADYFCQPGEVPARM